MHMRKKLKLIDLSCSHCNKEFQKYPSQVKSNKDTVFCGNQCVIDYIKIYWKGKIESTCIECGKEFKFNRAELNKCKGAGSYCSKVCQSKRNIEIECIFCHKNFKEYKSNIKRGRKYCSKKCYLSDCVNPIEKFFKSISNENHINNCWIWTDKKDKNGYGIIYVNKNTRAHRYSYELHRRKISDFLFVCHHCDNPSCVNPDHLFLGTALDNARDRDKKKRGYFAKKYKK
jgi:hypothetical protein